MADQSPESQNELPPVQVDARDSGSNVRGAPVAAADERDSYSITPQSRSDNRPDSELASKHIHNLGKGSLDHDVEQGVSSDRHSTSSTSSRLSIELHRTVNWITKQRVTIIDVNSVGKPTQHPRVWVDDPAERAKPEAIPDQPPGCVRIFILERGGIHRGEGTEIGLRSAPEFAKALSDAFPRIKKAAKKHVLSDILRPVLEMMMEIPTMEKWIQYRFHRKFSVRYLQKILRFESDDPGFILQTDFQESCFHRKTRPLGPDDPEANPLLSSRKSFNMGDFGLGLEFWQVYTAVKMNLLRDEAATVICEFPALLFDAEQPSSLLDIVSPGQAKFEELLLSTRSALQLSTGETQFTCQLILLDLMRSVSQSWHTFFQKLNLSPVMDTYLPGKVTVSVELEEDVDTSAIISSIIRDYAACVSFLTSSIEAKLKAKQPGGDHEVGSHEARSHEARSHEAGNHEVGDEDRKFKWDALVSEMEYLNQELQDMANDLLERSNRELSFFMANVNQNQADSARRLTIVASIFLPLTLSASLMAMTIHVRDIGDFWYDWVGLCLVTGSIVLLVFSVWKHTEKATRRGPLYSVRSLIPWLVGKLPMTWGLMLLFVVTASFLVGMFHTKRTALDVLKYGVPGVIALACLWIMKKTLPFGWKLFPAVTPVVKCFWAVYRARKT